MYALLTDYKQCCGVSAFSPSAGTATKLEDFYAKKSDFESNGGKFTDVVLGESSTVDLSEQLENLNYTGGTADYEGEEGAEYCYAPVQSHKAETAVLEPDTEYVYCVGDGSANTTSITDPQVIRTPAADTDTFDFLFFTDAQQGASGSYEATLGDYSDMKQMLGRAVSDYPDAAFLISGGDQVNYGFDTWEWDAFFESGKDIFSGYPLYLSTGNHECDGAGNEWTESGDDWTPVDQSCSAVLGRYNPPENGAAYYGGGESGTERMTSGVTKMEAMAGNYYFIYGDTLFLVLDYQDSTLGELSEVQQDWVRSVVKNNPTKWRVAVMHKTLFGYRVSDPTTGVYRSWSDTFDEAGIDLVLMGHDHVYARTKYYADGAVTESQQPGSGTTYITGASANTDNRSGNYSENTYTLVHSSEDYGRAYVAISISPDEIRVTTKGIQNGQITTVEDNAFVTDTPRTYDLSDWEYPKVPEEEDDLSVTSVSLSGYAKEGQTLSASIEPASASVTYQWESSSDGQSGWTAIEGADSARYTVSSSDVGNYLRCTVTGTGFYHGTVSSDATAKVTSLSGGGLITVSASAGRGGSISPSGNVLVKSGEDQTFTFTPDEYYEIGSVKIDGVENDAAAESGSYTFEAVTDLHTIEVTFRLADDVSGTAPSLVSTDAYYNRSQENHINLTVDFGEGALGIPEEDRRDCVESVLIVKDGQTVFDCDGCYWFPSHGGADEPPAELFQICYDDMQKKADYENLVPGTYDLVITFTDLQSTTCTIPLTVTDAPVHQLAVEGGTLTAAGAQDDQSSEIAEGTEVTVTADIPDGQRFVRWDASGLDGLTDADLTSETFTFKMPAGDISLRAVFRTSSGSGSGSGGSGSGPDNTDNTGKPEDPADPEQPGDQIVSFTDVSTDDWFAEAVKYVSDHGLMKGTDASTFSPQETTTRGMIVTMLYRLEREPEVSGSSFSDVSSGAYYEKAVAWAVKNGIVTGYGDGTFGPNDNITREQMATLLYRYASFKGCDMTPSADLSRYADASQISGYAADAMRWANAESLINGTTDTALSPQGNATRAEVATLMMRFCETAAGMDARN